MTEPVLQGLVAPRRTKFVVLPPAPAKKSASFRSNDDALVIDESFLALFLMDDFQGGVPVIDDRPLPNGVSSSASSSSHPVGWSAVFRAAALPSIIDDEQVVPRPSQGEDDEARVFLDASELARRGVRSGDWAVLRPPEGAGDRGTMEKIVRVFALPPDQSPYAFFRRSRSSLTMLPRETDSCRNRQPETIYVSPTTLANIASPTLTLQLLASPPAIPTATSVSLARIASPHSLQKKFQPLFLSSLKSYFHDRRRCVQRGDILCVGIAEEKGRWIIPEDEAFEYVRLFLVLLVLS
jgi:peroxin-6